MNLEGVLFFPLTPFDRSGAVASDVLAEHIKGVLHHRPGAVFAACGTGEFHALSLDEHALVVETAVATAAGAAPVLAGAGGPLPHATGCARAAERRGADGLLLLPPYLVNGPVAGLVAYVEAVAAATELPIILYQRGGVRFEPEVVARLARHPRIVGFKDGLGDLDLVQRTVLAVREAVGEDFMFFNGMPTAELTQPAYRAVGVPLYSSAVFCIAPEVSVAFHTALRDEDDAARDELLTRFFRPLVELRDRVPGYAVALIKAGARLRGLDVGGVRPPLADPSEDDVAQLRALLDVADEFTGRARRG